MGVADQRGPLDPLRQLPEHAPGLREAFPHQEVHRAGSARPGRSTGHPVHESDSAVRPGWLVEGLLCPDAHPGPGGARENRRYRAGTRSGARLLA
eukprot:2854353-Heterocapsa_arctica.AAC.1